MAGLFALARLHLRHADEDFDLDVDTPGVCAMQTELSRALLQRSRSSMLTAKDKALALRSRHILMSSRAAPARVAPADRFSAATKAAARSKLAQSVAKTRARKVLDRNLRAAAQHKAERTAAGRPRPSFEEDGPRSLGSRTHKRQGRADYRAAVHRQTRKMQAATADKTAKRPLDSRDEWRRYRREAEDWEPPPRTAPAQPRYSSQKARACRAKQLATQRSSRLALGDSLLAPPQPLDKRSRGTPQQRNRHLGPSTTSRTKSTWSCSTTTTTTTRSRRSTTAAPSRSTTAAPSRSTTAAPKDRERIESLRALCAPCRRRPVKD